MKIDFGKMIMDIKDRPIQRDGKPVTLLDVCQEALIASYQDEQNLPSADKVKRFKLAMKLNGAEPDLELEELALIKTLVGKGFGPMIVGRVYSELESGGQLFGTA